jgi:hypothetical protein
MREENLLEWSGERESPDEPHAGWSEYCDCMILSPEWDDMIPERQDLYEALRPRIAASISLSGGLRVPQRWAWLEGCLPEIRVSSFEELARLRIISVANPDEPRFEDQDATQKTVKELPALATAHYMIETSI